MSSLLEQRQIQRNVRVHNRLATSYEDMHGEIFNPVEQARLRQALVRVREALPVGTTPPRALDFGCGSGNVTRHLVALGFDVISADVSRRFLELVARRHAGDSVTTYQTAGGDLTGLDDAIFDIAAAYSVLHHVPDYLAAVTELGRVTKPDGIVYIDFENSPQYWDAAPVYREFVRRASRPNWRKLLAAHNYYGKLRRLFDPKYSNEGDIHVWPEDHIEWDEIERLLKAQGFEVVFKEDYLLCRTTYRQDVYETYKNRCSDKRLMVFRKSMA